MQQGNETRSTILPVGSSSSLGMLGSPYSPADALPVPSQVGVTTGDNLSDVINGVRGVAYYTDTIGFGQSSSSLTAGMPISPLGVNYFVNTGQQCSNGANMYEYVQGIPNGSALGSKMQSALSGMGLPSLRGLAPGMMEDAEYALDPSRLINTMLGSGWPQCKKISMPVGDSFGRISDPDTGQAWIDSPDTATKGADGLMYQTRWVQDTDQAGNPVWLTKEQWQTTPKTMNPDGTPMSNTVEGFVNGIVNSPGKMISVGLLCFVAFIFLSKKR